MDNTENVTESTTIEYDSSPGYMKLFTGGDTFWAGREEIMMLQMLAAQNRKAGQADEQSKKKSGNYL